MSTTTSKRSWHWWVNAIAFVALAIIGVVLLLSQLKLKGSIPDVLKTIADALAYVVVAACAFTYASRKMGRKKGWIYMLVWAGAVVLIIIAMIIPLFA